MVSTRPKVLVNWDDYSENKLDVPNHQAVMRFQASSLRHHKGSSLSVFPRQAGVLHGFRRGDVQTCENPERRGAAATGATATGCY